MILSGVGGDELFGGYRRYLGGHYADAVPPPARLGAQRRRLWRGTCRPTGTRRCSTCCGWPRASSASAEMSADERYRSYLQVIGRETVRDLLLEPVAGADDPLARAFAGAGHGDELNRMFAVDAETQLPDDLLLLTDKMSMAVSLECRVPLLDHRTGRAGGRDAGGDQGARAGGSST